MRHSTILLLALSLLGATPSPRAGEINIYTEDYPPYNMLQEGSLSGLSVDVLGEILKRTDSCQTLADVHFTSWSRGYSMAKMKPDTMIFSTTRTAQREELFKWVGPIAKTSIGLLALKERNIKISGIDDLNRYQTGTVLQDIGEQLLLEAGVARDNIQSVSGQDVLKISLRKLVAGRIDLLAYELNVATHAAKSNGYDPGRFQRVYTLKEGELYFAFNRETDGALIESWQQALDAMKADGTHQRILDSYR